MHLLIASKVVRNLPQFLSLRWERDGRHIAHEVQLESSNILAMR